MYKSPLVGIGALSDQLGPCLDDAERADFIARLVIIAPVYDIRGLKRLLRVVYREDRGYLFHSDGVLKDIFDRLSLQLQSGTAPFLVSPPQEGTPRFPRIFASSQPNAGIDAYYLGKFLNMVMVDFDPDHDHLGIAVRGRINLRGLKFFHMDSPDILTVKRAWLLHY